MNGGLPETNFGMRTTTAANTSIPDVSTILIRALAVIGGGILLCFAFISVLGMGYATTYSGRILPGVSVAGVDLSGLQPVDAGVLLAQKLDYAQTGNIVLEAGLTGEASSSLGSQAGGPGPFTGPG